MAELFSGLGWCRHCKQKVNVYSNDEGKTFRCGFCGKNMEKEINVWKVKATDENLEKVFQSVLEHMPDDNGRGEIDEDTGIMRSVEWVIEHLIECGELKEEIE